MLSNRLLWAMMVAGDHGHNNKAKYVQHVNDRESASSFICVGDVAHPCAQQYDCFGFPLMKFNSINRYAAEI